MGLFNRFFGQKEGVYQEAEAVQEKDLESQPSVEVPAETDISHNDDGFAEFDGGTPEDKRILNAQDAYAEAHYINAKGGDYFKQTGEVVKFADMTGDLETSEQYRNDQEIAHEAYGYEIEGLNKMIVDAAKKNVGLQAVFISRTQPENEGLLWNHLKNSETAPLYEFDPNSKGNFDYQKLEYIAGKIGTDLQYLIEPKGNGSVNTYPVVKLAETNKDITFITNGTGIEEDYHPRVFKLDKYVMEQLGYELKAGEHKSIFPKKEGVE